MTQCTILFSYSLFTYTFHSLEQNSIDVYKYDKPITYMYFECSKTIE